MHAPAELEASKRRFRETASRMAGWGVWAVPAKLRSSTGLQSRDDALTEREPPFDWGGVLRGFRLAMYWPDW